MALGMTGSASSEGSDSVYANPALLSLDRQSQVQLGVEGAALSLRVTGGSGTGTAEGAPLRATTLGVTLPLPLKGALRDRVTLGLGFLAPTDVVVRARIHFPETVGFPLADRLQSVALHAGVGVELGRGLRIGAGVGALAALKGDVRVATDGSGRIGTQVSDTLVASYAPIVGASWESPSKRHRLGVVVRGALEGRFDVVIRADALGSIDIPPLHVSGVAQYEPWQVGVEAARVEGPLRLAFGVLYSHWLAFDGYAEATVRCEDAPNASSGCEATEPPRADYHSTVSPRLGVERKLTLGRSARLALRGGYAFDPSPAPEARGAANSFDHSRSVFTFGWGVAFDRLPLGLDGFTQVHVMHERRHRKLVELGATEPGLVTTSGLLVAGGLAVKVNWR